ncbi:MAG TPA: DNA translocase FtsK 4TM domain-containing protein [Bacteroidales bacterium]|nr:DNA translocase FtsK 4TM domain-containing protein [Bacteroidales bacterium]HOK98039.1 DNA translocase FtsK 4TM domain-containing protein [Bacteroidales bacterium]HPO64452.1 DNA translocase FtsK 4TM domain-containing protein [Bacteroidales bacterium]
MAKKKKTKDKLVEENEKDTVGRQEKFRVITGILLLFIALFLFLSLISYFFSWKNDQSFAKQDIGSEAVVHNWGGKLGAKIAYILFERTFGISCLGIPLLLLIIGLKFLGYKKFSLKRTLIIIPIGVLLFSISLGYFLGDMEGFLGSGLGGAMGYYVSHQWLNELLGKAGAGLLVVFILILYFTLSSAAFSRWFTHHVLLLFKTRPQQITATDGTTEVNQSNTPVTESFTEDVTRQISGEGLEIVFHHADGEEPSHDKDESMPTTNDHDDVNESEDEEIEMEIEENESDESAPDEVARLLSELGPYDPKIDLPRYQYPTIDLLEDHKSGNPEVTQEELISNKNKIVETLKNYKIEISHIKATIGPTVTLYEIIPAPGIRISKIKSLEDDIALSLAALGIRIIAPIPGKGTIGIEVPNRNPEVVSMRSVISNKRFLESNADLAIVLGKTISNETYVVDLAKMPHLLVAGATGQGKSVGLNAIITSLLYKKHPSEIKFVLIDPKKVELTPYARLERHFLAKLPNTEEPIITDTQKVIYTLNSLTVEMDTRYELLKKAHVRNIKEYNAKFKERRLNPEHGHRFLPYIILVIDEFADLIMTAGREVETPIARLAQLARAVGIHLIIATQRPTTNIITGVIKANFPARIAFRVTSMIDSRTILDAPGANQLVGRGDMLVSTGGDLIRVQCAFIDTPEIERIVDFISQQQGYPSAFILPEAPSENGEALADIDLNVRDSLFEEAARLVVLHQQGSTSLIQRKFSIGYNRAGRIMDQLEKAGIVGPAEGSKPRQVLIVDEHSLEQLLQQLNK